MFLLGTVTDCYFSQWKVVICKFALGGKGTISQKLLKTVLKLKLSNFYTMCKVLFGKASNWYMHKVHLLPLHSTTMIVDSLWSARTPSLKFCLGVATCALSEQLTSRSVSVDAGRSTLVSSSAMSFTVPDFTRLAFTMQVQAELNKEAQRAEAPPVFLGENVGRDVVSPDTGSHTNWWGCFLYFMF